MGMISGSQFDHLPNELLYCVFEYLNPIDLLYSFSNLNVRLTRLLADYLKISWKHLDLRHLNPNVFQFYSEKNFSPTGVESFSLTGDQFELISSKLGAKHRHLSIDLDRELFFSSDHGQCLRSLETFRIRSYPIVWSHSLVSFPQLTTVQVRLKSHWNVVELLRVLPVVKTFHVTIDADVSDSRSEVSSSPSATSIGPISRHLLDFSYEVSQRYGIVYFVTDYSSVESLVKEMRELRSLRLYLIGCLNTIIDGNRLQTNLFGHLHFLEEFHFFVQTYGGRRMKNIEDLRVLQWHFAAYSNELTDMHYLFTIPFQFQRLDQCLNEYFFQSLRTTRTSHVVDGKELGFGSIKHLTLSTELNENVISMLQQGFPSLESLKISPSNGKDHLSSLTLFRQTKLELKSIKRISFDRHCSAEISVLRLLVRLEELTFDRALFADFLHQLHRIDLQHLQRLNLYRVERADLETLFEEFPRLWQLRLNTLASDDEPPVRSFLHGICQHRSRPLSIVDLLQLYFKSSRRTLRLLRLGCFFERDEANLHGLVAKLIRKFLPEQRRFDIQSEKFHSTRCGHVQIHFFL